METKGWKDDLNPDEVMIKGSCRPSGTDSGPDLSLWHIFRYNGLSTTENMNLQPQNSDKMTCLAFLKSKQISGMTVGALTVKPPLTFAYSVDLLISQSRGGCRV